MKRKATNYPTLETERSGEEEVLLGTTPRSKKGTVLPVNFETTQKPFKYQHIWKRAFFKIKMQKAMKSLNEEILKFGTNNELMDADHNLKENIEEIIKKKEKKQETFRVLLNDAQTEKSPWYVINPEGFLKGVWNSVITLILIYTAVVMPVRLAFMEAVYFDTWTTIDFCIDILFFIDIFVNFFSAYYTKLGEKESRLRKIAWHYIKTWFFIDFVACIPFNLIEYEIFGEGDSPNKYSTLVRLSRIPRLYKLLKVTRILKIFRYYKSREYLDRIQDFLQINSRIYKLCKFVITVWLSVHIMGCLWFLSAKIEGLNYNTWVFRYGYLDSSVATQYIASIYWAFTTITTVGYGDISPGTELEQLVAILWMMAGVGFYSFTIGSLSSFLTAIDTKESILSSKLAAIHEFAKETGISQECKQKIRNCIRYNIEKTGTIMKDKHSLFKELPKKLRYEVSLSMYSGIAKNLRFFENKDQAFVIAFMPLLKPLKYDSEEYLWKEGAYADEVFFITNGRVNLVLSNEVCYKSFLRGSYIGEIEIVCKVSYRLSNAQACNNLDTLAISRNDFIQVLEDFPQEFNEIKKVASQRARLNKKAKEELEFFIKELQEKGKISSLVVQDTPDTESLDSSDNYLNGLEESISKTYLEMQKISNRMSSLENSVKLLTSYIKPPRKSGNLLKRMVNHDE